MIIPIAGRIYSLQWEDNEKRRAIMKKLTAAFLACAMVFSMTACAGGNATESKETQVQSQESETVQAVESEESVESETPAQEAESSSADETTAADETTGEAAEGSTAGVMSYEEYMAAEVDTEVTVEAYVQAKQSWWEDKATVYAQSPDGAYFFYNMVCSEEDYEKLVPGTKIQVTGYKAEWSGEVEIMDGTFEFVEGGDTYVAEPMDVTELLGTEELINHQNKLVEFKGMTVEAAGQDENGNDVAYLYNWDGSGTEGDDLYFNVSYNGQTYTFVVESYLCDSTSEVYAAVKNLQIGQTIDMEGFLYWYEGINPHITSVTVAE